MGKRSNMERVPRDFYPTPPEAVAPLLPHVQFNTAFAEPCAGDGALVRTLVTAGHRCVWAADIEPRADGIETWDAIQDQFPKALRAAETIITNPPWSRDVLHPMIKRFSNLRPTWLLIDADWIHTKQAAPFMPRLRKVVSVGRVKWIPGSKMTGKDNCVWMLFSRPMPIACEFVGRQA